MHRIEKLLQLMHEKNIDGYFSVSVPHITYLTGFTGDSSRLFVTGNRTVLITDGRYTEQASKECAPEIEIFKWIDNKRYAKETYQFLINQLSIQNLAFEQHAITYSEYKVLETSSENSNLIAVSGMVEKLRQIKEPGEIASLNTACEISDKALELTLPFIREGITELELTAQLEYQLKSNGAENLSFDSLILFGSRTSLLHGKPSIKKLAKGDLILFDFGALYKGYHADISRSFVLGKPTYQQKEIYEIIQAAQSAAIQSLQPGMEGKQADKVVRQNIPEKYLEYYYPGLGHGVGLQIHEEPFLGKDYESYIKENMTLTIEPGIYIPDWGGIRIEDTIWVKGEKAESLSKFPRELICL